MKIFDTISDSFERGRQGHVLLFVEEGGPLRKSNVQFSNILRTYFGSISFVVSRVSVEELERILRRL